jgi:HK97 family phage major capsid protein/HK97 family phage prohead protease
MVTGVDLRSALRLCYRNVEFRATGPVGDGRTLEGYAAVFDTPTTIESFAGEFEEVVKRGAFRKTLRDRAPVMQFDHGNDKRTGSVPIGAIEDLHEDDEGLFVNARLFANDVVEPIRQAVAGRAIRGMSFKFRVIRDQWVDRDGKKIPADDLAGLLENPGDRGPIRREIQEVELFELGPVVFPAYTQTSVGVRGSRFDPNAVAVRGVLGQFGLDERCVQRHLATFDPQERQVLAAEVVAAFPELADLLTARTTPPADPAPPAEPEPAPPAPVPSPLPAPSPPPGDAQSSPQPAPATAGRTTTEPALGHPVSKPEPRKHSKAPKPSAASRAATPPATTSQRSDDVQPTMTVDERRERQEEIRARLTEIDNEYMGAALPDETREEWTRLTEEHQTHQVAIDDAERRRVNLESLFNSNRGVEGGGGITAVTAPGLIPRRTDSDLYDLREIRRSASSEEDLRRLYRERAYEAVERAKFPGQKNKERAQSRALELLDTVDDESAALARRMLATGSPLYDRAFGKAVLARSTSGLTAEEARALSVGSDSDGGFAVPFQLDPTIILTSDGSSNPLRQISRVETIVGKEWQGVTSAGITVTRTPEVQEATDDAPDLDQPVVRPSAVHAFVPFSMDVEQDWTRLRAEMTRLLNNAKDDEEAESFVNGDGSLISGGGHQPDGIAAGLAAASEVPGGASFTSQDLYDLEAGDNGLGERFLARAVWLANRSIYNLVRQFDTAGGADLWVRLGAGQPAELIGYSAFRASAMPSSPTGRYLILGDFNEFLVVDRVGMSVELVPHLFGAARRFPTGQRGIYARWRNTTKILVDNAFRVLTDDES